jgi:hypothetical protein
MELLSEGPRCPEVDVLTVVPGADARWDRPGQRRGLRRHPEFGGGGVAPDFFPHVPGTVGGTVLQRRR